MRYFIELSYNGKSFHGWQNQPNAETVQNTIEQALSMLLKQNINIVGAGRTDTGVHALQMFAHFNVEMQLDTKHLIFKLNAFLPKTIAVHNIFLVKDNAHARFDALSRTYIYRIAFNKNVFTYDNAYHLKHHLDMERMNIAGKILFDYKDFQCFSKSNTDVKTYDCNITEAHWKIENSELVFTISANRFLRNMVRAIVGTMIEIGSDKMNVEELHNVIKSKNRSNAGASVPGYALYLSKIEYPKSIQIL